MDLEKLKGATLDDKTFDALKAHVESLAERAETAEGKARKAAQESIDGRKTLKAERDKAFDKLGISTADELDALPDGKGAGEATKQLETQVKKLTRERDDAIAARDSTTGELKSMKRSNLLAQALQGHRFKNAADVQVLLERRLVEEGDEFLFKTDDGKTVSLKDGAAWFAKTRPDYVEPSDGGGQGSGFKGGSGGAGKTVTRAQFEATPAHKQAELLKDAVLVDA